MRRLARLDTVGSDHAPVQFEIDIGEEGTLKSPYKCNLTYLNDKMSDVLGQRWTTLLENTFFFNKLRDIKRFYKHYSKTNTKEYRKLELIPKLI
jgi:hypothetical protein